MRALTILAVLIATGAAAQEPAGTVYRLSPDQIDAIDPKPPAVDPKLKFDPLFDRSLFDSREGARRDRRPHGEVGAFVGSGGARGIYGTTEVPIGETGSAAFSFSNSDYGDRRYYRPR